MSSRSSVSIFFFAGHFQEALRRWDTSEPQTYATHDEVSRLIRELAADGVAVSVYSFISDGSRVARIEDNITIVELGAKTYRDDQALLNAVDRDKSDLLIPHIPNVALLRACAASGRPTMAVLASSYHLNGPRARFQRYQLRKALNRPEIELVANHCEPATSHLKRMGVNAEKLVAWDIPHTYSPFDRAAKTLDSGIRPELFYAGTISESKGCFEIVRAIGQLREWGCNVGATFAGRGETDALLALAKKLKIEDRIRLAGVIPNNEVFSAFCNATIAVVPSRHRFREGFPLTMFEAIASRTPIVCSDHPVFMPVMEHGKSAMIYRSGDAKDLARAVRKIVDDPALYTQLSNNATVSWERLKGPADWRTLLGSWVREGMNSEYVASHVGR